MKSKTNNPDSKLFISNRKIEQVFTSDWGYSPEEPNYPELRAKSNEDLKLKYEEPMLNLLEDLCEQNDKRIVEVCIRLLNDQRGVRHFHGGETAWVVALTILKERGCFDKVRESIKVFYDRCQRTKLPWPAKIQVSRLLESSLMFDRINEYVEISDYRNNLEQLKKIFLELGLNLTWSRPDIPEPNKFTNDIKTNPMIGEILSGPKRVFSKTGRMLYFKVKIDSKTEGYAWGYYPCNLRIGSKVAIQKRAKLSDISPGIDYSLEPLSNFSGLKSLINGYELPESAPLGVAAAKYYSQLPGIDVLLFIEDFDAIFKNESGEYEVAKRISKTLNRPLKLKRPPKKDNLPIYTRPKKTDTWNNITWDEIVKISDEAGRIDGVVTGSFHPYEVAVDIGVTAWLKNTDVELGVSGDIALKKLRGKKFSFKIKSIASDEWPTILLTSPKKI